MKVSYLFPGQGAQYPDMLHDIIDANIDKENIILNILEILNLRCEDVDSENALSHTANVQLCLLLSSVVTAKYLISLGIAPTYVAGNSIGAFGAAVIAGSIDVIDAAKLVLLRGKLMEEAYPKGYGMLAVVGFSSSRLSQEVNRFNDVHDEKDWIYLANYNTSIQIVLAGPIISLQTIAGILEEKGVRSAKLLKMSVPSHCKLLNSVSEQLSSIVDTITINTPTIPYLSNITGRLVRNREGLKRDLGQNVSHAVLWHDGMQLLYEMGTRFYVEMSPSGVLTKIIKDQFEDSTAMSINLNNWDTILYRYNNFII